MPEHTPNFPTKFKKGDWVYYRNSMYRIITFDNNVHGWQYIIQRDNWTHQVNLSDGDKYFRKA